MAAATAGQTVCLATGDYGTWTGTNKAITVTAAAGASPTMTVDFASGASGFTLSGMGGMSGTIDSPANNITITGSVFTNSLVLGGISPLANANIVISYDSFSDGFVNPTCSAQPAMLHLAYASTTPAGITIKDNIFAGGNKEGVEGGPSGVTVEDNVFYDLLSEGSCNHMDSIQGTNTTGFTVVGNLCEDDFICFADWDGSRDDTVTDNACITPMGSDACLALYGDIDSVMNHNTAVGEATGRQNVTDMSIKPSSDCPPSEGCTDPVGTVLENNVGAQGWPTTPLAAINRSNLFSGASSPNIDGRPTVVGGSSPTTWAGAELASGSAGLDAATDRLSVGIRASAGGPALSTQAPANTALPVISGTVAVGDTLSVTTGTWAVGTGGVPTAYTYQWENCKTSGGDCVHETGCGTVSCSGANYIASVTQAPTYTIQSEDEGRTIEAVVTAVNANGVTSAAAGVVGPPS